MECMNYFFDSENEPDEIKYMIYSDDDEENQIFLYTKEDESEANEPKNDPDEKDPGVIKDPQIVGSMEVIKNTEVIKDPEIMVNTEIVSGTEILKDPVIKKDSEIHMNFQNNLLMNNIQNGNSRHCVCNPLCYFQDKKKIIEYVQNVVLVGQHDKFTKIDKVITFQVLCEYIKKEFPNLEHDEKLKKLSRNEKRMLPQLNERFYKIGFLIYEVFQTSKREEIILNILQKIDHLLIEKLEMELLTTENCKKQILLEKLKDELADIKKRISEKEKKAPKRRRKKMT